MTIEREQTTTRAGIEGLTPTHESSQGYDATRDPRTGRPPTPAEAQRLARERETRQEEEPGSEEANPAESPVPDDQKPARMTSPEASKNERAAVDALVEEGVSRERAEELVGTHGSNRETLRAAAFAGDQSDQREDERKNALAVHHTTGIPPAEPPERGS